MAVYAIGDIQGCFDSLIKLTEVIEFNVDRDQLIFAGDLVNRGPKSLETLRFVAGLPVGNDSVLGNHDLHLLAMVHAPSSYHKITADLQRLFDAPDADDLLEWLRHRPLALFRDDLATLVVHAAIHPDWSLDTLLELADEVETLIQGPNIGTFFKHMYGNEPSVWSPQLKGFERARYIVNLFTRTRYFDTHRRLCFDAKGPPATAPKHLIPWFELPRALDPHIRLVFGHWSTLGQYLTPDVCGIDTGCLWGRQLTALRLDSPNSDDPIIASIDCPAHRLPSSGDSIPVAIESNRESSPLRR